jgi:hypothetical protein
MPSTIHKFKISLVSRQKVVMPNGAVILTAQMQRDQMCLWAIVPFNPDPFRKTTEFNPNEQSVYQTRIIEVFGTGHPMDDSPRKYISTVLTDDGDFVWHVFELGE